MKTPIQKLIFAFDQAINAMEDSQDNIVKQTTIQCKELALIFLLDERNDIKNAFNSGEQNVWDKQRDGDYFQYQNGEDYFNKNYKNK